MIEPRQEDIERNEKSFTALYDQLGRRPWEFINHMAESMAYQQALVRDYKEREAEQIRADLRLPKWTNNIPVKPGSYWFYSSTEKEIKLVESWESFPNDTLWFNSIVDDMYYDKNLLEKNEIVGWWLEILEPTPPK